MELLLPANKETLETAVENGADAVYLGIKKFNARIKSKNFSLDELEEAVEYCHKNGVRVYVTLNTLVKNSEIEDFFKTIKEVYIRNADAIIVQELSFIPIIKKNFPNMEIHVSTQARIMNLASIKKLNADRIILARELTKEDVDYISKNSSIPVEVFVHGALCFCVSGMCLMSSLIGGRSGNRGLCAQPCRKKYNDEYVMSMKDLALIKNLPNVKALKIEGRIRSKKYVEKVCKAYRKAIDEGIIEYDALKSAFNRELTEGFYSKEKNKTAKHNLKFEEKEINYNYVNKKKPIRIKRKNKEIFIPKINEKSSKQKIYCKVYNLNGVREANRYANVIVYFIDKKDIFKAKEICEKEFFVQLPAFMNDKEVEYYTEKLKKIKPDGVISENLAFSGIMDYNVFNDYDLEYFGTSIISPELNFKELKKFKNKDFIVRVHGNIPVMTTKNCLSSKLKDEKGYEFKVIKEKDYRVLNSKEIALLDKILLLKKEGINQYYFDLDKRVKKWLDIYTKILKGEKLNFKKLGKGFTMGHFFRGV